MTAQENYLRAWIDETFRPAIREVLRDELADILPGFLTGTVPATPTAEEAPINLKEAADFLGIAPQTVYQNINKIPSRKKHGRHYFLKSELAAYLETAKRTAA
jgi:predicted DNA-binding transcriptional regulator AlpA